MKEFNEKAFAQAMETIRKYQDEAGILSSLSARKVLIPEPVLRLLAEKGYETKEQIMELIKSLQAKRR